MQLPKGLVGLNISSLHAHFQPWEASTTSWGGPERARVCIKYGIHNSGGQSRLQIITLILTTRVINEMQNSQEPRGSRRSGSAYRVDDDLNIGVCMDCYRPFVAVEPRRIPVYATPAVCDPEATT